MMTKTEVAQFLGVSERAVERYTKAEKLQATYFKRPTGGQVAQYDRAAVEAFKQSMEDAKLEPLETAPTPRRQFDKVTVDDGESRALVKAESAGELAQVLATAFNAARDSEPAVKLSDRLTLTLPEAAAYSGIGITHLEAAIAGGALRSHKLGTRGARVVKRKDVEAYVDQL